MQISDIFYYPQKKIESYILYILPARMDMQEWHSLYTNANLELDFASDSVSRLIFFSLPAQYSIDIFLFSETKSGPLIYNCEV